MEEKFPQRIEKPWGFELILAQTAKYAGKLIFVQKGHRFSLHYHKSKDECIYIYAGKCLIEVDNGNGQLAQSTVQSGYRLRIPPLTKHRLKALEDVTLFEVSTPEMEDVERLEDDYGRV